MGENRLQGTPLCEDSVVGRCAHHHYVAYW